ncbi:relaxase/mobilization nuclease domain-containing protein [Pacificimonas flava]|uniref:Relaxase/mobilization nuclease family protein n=1 Tax=Pacificimonas flava TaxID=1234595 RepID=M2TJS5_9SPHN|nr:relaxase/mobilization nuclease domain-containing protein [Pacificimonas flava]EMD81896.1 Relaxase/mobilization nuclease family protein [Pacificimonas flava]MBB5281574.1 hypothetical protein [Pacificimonas flava]
MIVKLIRMTSRKGRLAELRDNVYALTRYVVDADPWAMAMIDRERVRSLTEYLIDARAHGIEPGEKAGHVGQRNLLTTELGDQQVEMLAVANGSPRIEYPVVHIIVSWQGREQPDPSQLKDTVDTMLAVTGLSVCPTLFAQHTNTEHPHLHIAVVRADPANGRAAGSEWLIEDLHQAIAILEERHGWAAEPNALYYARDGAVFDAKVRRFGGGSRGEEIVDPISEVMVRDAAGKFLKPRDRKGVAAEIVNLHADIIRARNEAKDWDDFHAHLEIHQIAYRAKGSGARIHVGDTSNKASTVDPDLALKQMEKRFGPFVPNPGDRIPGFDEYREAHKAQLKRLRAERAKAQATLDAWAKDQSSAIATAGNRFAERAVRAERDAAQKELNAAFAAAIKTCTNARHTKLEEWRDAGSPILPPVIPSPSLLLPSGNGEKGWAPPAGLRAEPHEWSTRYYDEADRLVFTDHRIVIIVHRPTSTDGLDAALTIAAERWGTVRVNGSKAFQERCSERARALGIQVVDADNRSLVVKAASKLPESVATPASPRPDYRADPARRAALDRTLASLGRMAVLPTRRRGPASAAGPAPLEIVFDADRSNPGPNLQTAAFFEEDPEIQDYLAKRRAGMLSTVNRCLLQHPVPLNRKDVLEVLDHPDGLRHAAFLAFEDADFQAMLERVALRRERMKRENVQGNAETDRDTKFDEPVSGLDSEKAATSIDRQGHDHEASSQGSPSDLEKLHYLEQIRRYRSTDRSS